MNPADIEISRRWNKLRPIDFLISPEPVRRSGFGFCTDDVADFKRAASAPNSTRATREEMTMKSNYKIAAAVITSFVMGAGAISVLHAQAKLPAYVIAEIDVKDQDGYTKDFLPKAQANIKEFGGKYIAGGLNKAVGFFGPPPPNRVVLLQFADMDAVKAFEGKEQRNVSEVGSKYASFRVFGVEGVEQK
jgi:uncharacterized protein (DUF1330 family)